MARDKSVLTVTDIQWLNTEDVYEEGEVGQSFTVLAERNVGRYSSPDEMRRDLIKRFGLPEDRDSWMAFDDGRIDVQMLVNEENFQASAREIAQWKKGEQQLWTADVSIYFVESVERVPSQAEIAKMFGISES